jgi:hypothetical protein
MKMDSGTIIFLLKGGHLNMVERKEKGTWPHPPLVLEELIDELTKYLQTTKWFPHKWVERKNGELIDDVAVIEKVTDTKVIYRARAASPSNLTIITAQTEKTFGSVRDAAEYYIKNVLNLPGDLDSWQVIEKKNL